MKAMSGKKQKRKRILRAVLIMLVIYCVLLAVGGYFYDARHAELIMLGDRDIVLEYGSVYTDAGAVAYTTGRLFDGDDLEVTVTGPENISEVGTYSIQYSCTYKKQTLTDSRNIVIRDTTNPVITLEPNGPFNARESTGFEEPGYTATDNHDGVITDRVEVRVLNDCVIYTVSDTSGNTVSAEREIIYAPTEPTILLEGGDSITIDASVLYSDPGFCALDSAGNDVSSQVKVELVSVDGKAVNGKNGGNDKEKEKKVEFTPYLPGTYVFRYSLEENKNVVIEKERTVTVVPVEMPQSVEPGRPTIYLTFDDGPGPYTEELLDILAKYDVKATFFVTGQNPDYYYLMTREAREGHTVAVHTYSHDCYSHGSTDIYSSVEAYYNDFMAMRELIHDYTGIYTDMFRFPGGSSNTISSFNPGIMTTLTEAMPAMGFKYFDWNASSGDAGSYKYTSEKILEFSTTGSEGIENEINTWGYAILLQHDLKDFSVGAVEGIIKWGLAKGYVFAALDMTSPRARHGVFN